MQAPVFPAGERVGTVSAAGVRSPTVQALAGGRAGDEGGEARGGDGSTEKAVVDGAQVRVGGHVLEQADQVRLGGLLSASSAVMITVIWKRRSDLKSCASRGRGAGRVQARNVVQTCTSWSRSRGVAAHVLSEDDDLRIRLRAPQLVAHGSHADAQLGLHGLAQGDRVCFVSNGGEGTESTRCCCFQSCSRAPADLQRGDDHPPNTARATAPAKVAPSATPAPRPK